MSNLNISSHKASIVWVAILLGSAGCASLPDPEMKVHQFPKEAVFFDSPQHRPYEVLGRARTKVNFPSLDGKHDEGQLCKNYFNKAANDLLTRAKKSGGDAVMEFRSVVFLLDGKVEQHRTAECSDDGEEGQILAEGWVIRWKPVATQNDK